MRLLALFLLVLFRASALQAQTGIVEGTVVDGASQQPVPYASIGLLHSPLGTVSNSLGVFRLLVSTTQPTDSLLISCVGYASYRVRLASVGGGPPIRFVLTPQAVSLQAATVVGYTPQTLLKQAVRRTHAQLLSPALLKSYYREFVRVNDTYTKFADGLVEYRVVANPRKLFKPDVQVRVTQSRAKIVQAANRRIQDVPSVLDVEQAINGYERDSQIHSNFLDSTAFSFYKYELREPVGPVAEPFYVIAFTPTTHDAQHLYQGTVRVDKQTGCFQAIDVDLPADLKPYTNSANILILKVKEVSVHKHLDYRQLNGRCYLGFVRVEYGVDVTYQGTVAPYVFTTEVVVTEALTTAPPIAKQEQYHGRSLFSKGTHYTYPFWQQANRLAATPAEEAIIAGLSATE